MNSIRFSEFRRLENRRILCDAITFYGGPCCVLMPDHEPIRHPITAEPVTLGSGEHLQRIAWPGAPVVVVNRPGPAGELLYMRARCSCQRWNTADGLHFESVTL